MSGILILLMAMTADARVVYPPGSSSSTTTVTTDTAQSISGVKTFTSSVTINDGTSGGLLVKGDSVTASAFYGDGSHLTGIASAAGENPTYSASTKTITQQLQVGGPGQASPPTTLNVDGSAQFGSGVTKATVTTAGVINAPANVTLLGNLGVGTASPGQRLDVEGGATKLNGRVGIGDDPVTTAQQYTRNTLGNGTYTAWFRGPNSSIGFEDNILKGDINGDGSGPVDIVIQKNGFFVGIDTGIPQATLDLNGSAIIRNFKSSSTWLGNNAIQTFSSVTASAFFGDGSHLTGISAAGETNTFNSTKTFGSNVLFKGQTEFDGTETNFSTVTISAQDALGFTLSLSSGLSMPSGVLKSTGVETVVASVDRLRLSTLNNRSDINFFTGSCAKDGSQAVTDISASGKFQCTNLGVLTYYSSVTFNNNTLFNSFSLHSGSSITLTGVNGYISGSSSVTASAFFGDGSHLTGIAGIIGADMMTTDTPQLVTAAGVKTWLSSMTVINTAIFGSTTQVNESGAIIANSTSTAASDVAATIGTSLGQAIMMIKNNGSVVISTDPAFIAAMSNASEFILNGGVSLGTSPIDRFIVSDSGQVTFTGQGTILIATGGRVFCSAASQNICFRFDANANGGFNFSNAGIRFFAARSTGQTSIGLVSVVNGISTFSATGLFTTANDIAVTGNGTVAGTLALGGQAASTELTIRGVITSSTTMGTVACNLGTPLLTATATDSHGEYSAGIGATNCTYTFGTAWPKKPDCSCGTDAATPIAISALATTTTIKCTGAAALTGDNITYKCEGAP